MSNEEAEFIGFTIGLMVFYTLIPALIAGLFRRRMEPAHARIRWTWAVVSILALANVFFGGVPFVPIAFAVAVLGLLTVMRYRAWGKRTETKGGL